METATEVLHRLTSYEPGREWTDPVDDARIVQDLEVNDLERLPWFYKRYPEGLPEVELPRELPVMFAPALDVLAGSAVMDNRELDLSQLARLLHLSAGVVRTIQRPYGTYLFRAAGSAGGRFPLEVYVSVPDGGSLPPGVFWYHPERHRLVEIGPPPLGGSPAVVVTGVPWRTGWRYRERGYRHIYWDAGTMLSQLLAAADSAGFPAELHTRFGDWEVGALVGADGPHEFPVAVVALGPAPALDGSGAAQHGVVDSEPLEFPLVTEAQRAGEWHGLERPWPRGEVVATAATGSGSIDEVILRRGSQRRLDRSKGVAREVFQTAMEVSLRGIHVSHLVAINDVEGIAPGVYRWPDLHPLRTGNLRDELYRVCLEQSLPSDAAFVVISVTDVSRLDARGYRDAQLAAGIAAGRLHLAAYALDVAASGMTFLDSEIASFTGQSDEPDGLLFTCVGVPEYRSRPGGPPGNPTDILGVTPRL